MHIAAANGYIQVMEFLLSHGVSVDPLDEDSWQPIHCAACWGQVSWFSLYNNKIIIIITTTTTTAATTTTITICLNGGRDAVAQ